MWYWHDPGDLYGMRSSRFQGGWFPIMEGDSALSKPSVRVAYQPELWATPEGDEDCLGDVEVQLTHPVDGRLWYVQWYESVEREVLSKLPGH